MKKCLIVVDYQNDFVIGTLASKNAQAIEKSIVELIEEYKSNGEDIIFTLDTHEQNYMDTQEGHNLPVTHCIKGTSGHELYGQVQSLSKGYKKIEKPAFPSLELGNYLKNKDYDEINLVGVVSHICVISNAIIAKAALPEATINIIKAAVASEDLETQEACFQVCENGLQIHIL